jgi:hypothetical protein
MQEAFWGETAEPFPAVELFFPMQGIEHWAMLGDPGAPFMLKATGSSFFLTEENVDMRAT